MAKYVSSINLSYFLSKLKNIFSDKNHIHTITEVDGLQNSIANLESRTQYNIIPITQDEYDALTDIDENTLYVIEV